MWQAKQLDHWQQPRNEKYNNKYIASFSFFLFFFFLRIQNVSLKRSSWLRLPGHKHLLEDGWVLLNPADKAASGGWSCSELIVGCGLWLLPFLSLGAIPSSHGRPLVDQRVLGMAWEIPTDSLTYLCWDTVRLLSRLTSQTPGTGFWRARWSGRYHHWLWMLTREAWWQHMLLGVFSKPQSTPSS